MAITNARMQQKRGLEADFDPDKMLPGEWAVSTDKKYVRMCFSVGVCVRMATYEAFEEDMTEIIAILAEAKTAQEAIEKIYEEFKSAELDIEAAKDAATLSESYAHGSTGTREGEDTDNAKYYAEQAEESAQNALAIAEDVNSKLIFGKPIFLFVDDDGTSQFNDLYSEVLEPKGIIGGLAVMSNTYDTEYVTYLTQEEILGYQSKGWSILNHSSSGDTITLENVDVNLPYAIKKFKNSGYENRHNIFVYPNGNYLEDADAIADKVSEYFSYGFNIAVNNNQKIGLPLTNKYNMGRVFISEDLEDSTKTFIKSSIDEAIENNFMLIISTHASTYNKEYLCEVIDYIQGLGYGFTPIDEAFDMIENNTQQIIADGIKKQISQEGTNTDISFATTSKAGIVKPDGATITVDDDGTIHAQGSSGTTDYSNLSNKPTINGVELSGNRTTSDLGINASDVGADPEGSASAALEESKEYTDSEIEVIEQSIGNKLDKDGDSKDNTVTFAQASERESLASTEKHSTLFGKIAKWLSDLKTVAFSGSYNDLSNRPTIPSKTSQLTNDSGFLSSATALDTYEEIMANTESGKFAGSNGVKEGFEQLTDSLRVLLWENSNPTAEFSAQTIALDLSKYTHIEIEHVGYPTANIEYIINSKCPVGYSSVLMSVIGVTESYLNTRTIIVNNTGIEFKDGYRMAGSNNLSTKSNYSCRPIKIYGVK